MFYIEHLFFISKLFSKYSVRVIHGCEYYTEKFGTSPTKLPCCYFCQGTKVNIISFYRFRRSAFSVTTWHHRTLPKIPIWPKILIIRWVWILGAFFFFFFWKNPRLIGGLIRYLRFDIFIEKIS